MFKKLLIAVFILGLILTFGNAFADQRLQEQMKPNDGISKVGVSLENITNTHILLPPGYTAPFPMPNISMPTLIDIADAVDEGPVTAKSGCYEDDHTNTAVGYFTWEHGTGADIPLGDAYAMRFDRQSQALHEVSGVRLRVYDWDYAYELDYLGEDSIVGDADIVVKIWDDISGLPNSVIYTQVIPMSYLEDNLYDGSADPGDEKSFNYLFPLDEAVTITDPSYHISFQVVNNGAPGAYVVNGSDAGDLGSGRGSYYDFVTDTWYDNETYWCPIFISWGITWGCDPNWRIVSSYCELSADGFCYNAEGTFGGSFFGLEFPSTFYATDASTWNGYAQIYYSSVAEYLSDVKVYHLVGGLSEYLLSTQTNGLKVSVYGDDAGEIDLTDLITTKTLTGVADLYPGTGDVIDAAGWEVVYFDFSSEYIQLPSAYHLTVEATGDDPADGFIYAPYQDDYYIGSTVTGGSIKYDTQGWERLYNQPLWGVEPWTDGGFLVRAVVCEDEFFKCDYEHPFNEFGLPWSGSAWWMYNGSTVKAVAAPMKGKLFNHVTTLRWQVVDETEYGGEPEDSGEPIMRLMLKNNNSDGTPGTTIWSKDVAWADFTIYPGWHEEVIDEYVEGNFFVALEIVYTTSGDQINYPRDALGLPEINGGGYVYYLPWGQWVSSRLFYAPGTPGRNFYMQAEYCAIPIPEAACDPDNDDGWTTFQGDMARTGASDLAVGEPWCDLSLQANYLHPTDGINFASPIIYGDRVVQCFENTIVVLNLADLSPIYTLDATTGGGALIGLDMRCTPTVMPLDMDDDPLTDDIDVMFIAGGSSNGVAAINFANGNILWQFDIEHPGGPGELFGGTRYCTFTVLDVDGTTIVVYGTDAGNIVARDVFTGARLWVTNLSAGSPQVSGATDGTDLYFNTYTSAGEGDVYCLAGIDGEILWQLTGRDGLYADDLFGDDLGEGEGFRGGIAYDAEDASLYMASTANWAASAGQDGDLTVDGVFYKLDAATGDWVVTPVVANRGNFNTPIIDKMNVFVPSFTSWGAGASGNGAALGCYTKLTLGTVWTNENPTYGRYYMSGFRTCEPDGVDDLLFVFNEDGFLECYNSVTGDQIFTRRIDHDDSYGPNVGLGGAIAEVDEVINIVFADSNGGLYNLTADPTRDIGRLSFETYNIQAVAEFGLLTSISVDFGEFITNTGCFPVTVTSVTGSDESFGGRVPDMSSSLISDDMITASNSIANNIIGDSKIFMAANNFDNVEGFDVRSFDRELSSKSYASVGLPLWVNSITEPYAGQVLAPEDVVNLIVDVNQTEISRGAQFLYIQMETDDPDFFLNMDLSKVVDPMPEASVTLVGGCLTQRILLYFGMADESFTWVTNATWMGDGDWDPWQYEIQGVGNSSDGWPIFGSYYFSAVDSLRIAFNGSDYYSNVDDHWVSIQADPNYCDPGLSCVPYLDPNVSVGAIWDGVSAYTPMLADMVCKTWLDSVQDFDTDASDTLLVWSWTQGGDNPMDAPFAHDSMQIGLMCNERVFGVHDVVELADFSFEIFDIWNRNATPVDRTWYFSLLADPDGAYLFTGASKDSAAIDRSISAAWNYAVTTEGEQLGAAYGTIKIPFGCGNDDYGDWDFTPMINVKSLTQAWVGPMDNFLDSAYWWMSQATGLLDGAAGPDDSKSFNTIVAHDFAGAGDPAGGDTYSFGVATFQLVDLTNAAVGTEIAPLAHMINKWAGFGRGDVNNDNVINLIDLMYLLNTIAGGQGAVPFAHLADVDASGVVDVADFDYLLEYYFECGACPRGDWMF